jgi:spore coat protein U-like protein
MLRQPAEGPALARVVPIVLCAAAMAASGFSSASAASLASCTVSGSGINFGLYNPLAGGDSTTSGNITTNCSLLLGISLLVVYTVSLSAGNGTFAQRQMQSGSSKLYYNLFSNSADTNVWGDGSAGTSTVTDGYLLGLGGNPRSYDVYGKIPAGQSMVGAGSYNDTVVITIAF